MKIYFYIQAGGNKIGSTNENKIRLLSEGRKVFCCDIVDFNGNLDLNSKF
jgi:hypothetical protein